MKEKINNKRCLNIDFKGVILQSVNQIHGSTTLEKKTLLYYYNYN